MDNAQRTYIIGALKTIKHAVRCSAEEVKPHKYEIAIKLIDRLIKKVNENELEG